MPNRERAARSAREARQTAILALADGTAVRGRGMGAAGRAVGELCFNTSMTGYQEIVTDPSYAGQIIAFTFPHIGNAGANAEDVEAARPAARGCVLRAPIGAPSNWRAAARLDAWLADRGVPAITGVDTRALTRLVRAQGAPAAVLVHDPAGGFETGFGAGALAAEAAAWPGLAGMDLTREVSTREAYSWTETQWTRGAGYGAPAPPRHRVVAIDYGAKRNILRCLASAGCGVTAVPARTPAAEILARRPDGVFLSNGPGDPAATGAWAAPIIRELVESGIPVFGICLGCQLLALALGARTVKMRQGHRGANHPVRDLATGRVEITSQNHGFAIDAGSLPAGLAATHVSLFDGTLEGVRAEGKPAFGVQYHPEASPGPRDSRHLFDRFAAAMDG